MTALKLPLMSSAVDATRAATAACVAVGLAVGGVAAIGLTPSDAEARLPVQGFADLAAELTPSVVNITTAQTVDTPNRPMPQLPPGSPFGDFFRDFFDRRGGGGGEDGPRRMQSQGSGFVIESSGFIVTNNHVIEGAEDIVVEFSNGESYPAELKGADPQTDIALLKIDAGKPLPAVPFGDSDAARVGDLVLAIGNPFGQGFSVSAGIISARGRDINAGRYDDFIQTDAAINRGNSGGPLFNMEGEVIGVNTAIISPTGGSIGIGFSVPASLTQSVVAQLREFGETRRGWLGVRIQLVDEAIAESLGLERAYGALVSVVEDASPAEAGGVEKGDVITSFNGREIQTMRDLPRIVAETPVGDTVPVEVFRDGAFEVLNVDIALLDEARLASAGGSSPDTAPSEPEATVVLGMTLETLTRQLRERHSLSDDVDGVFIADVDGASSAYERGVRRGDVLVEVAQTPVSTAEQASSEIEEAQAGGRNSVLLMVARGGELRFVAVEFAR